MATHVMVESVSSSHLVGLRSPQISGSGIGGPADFSRNPTCHPSPRRSTPRHGPCAFSSEFSLSAPPSGCDRPRFSRHEYLSIHSPPFSSPSSSPSRHHELQDRCRMVRIQRRTVLFTAPPLLLEPSTRLKSWRSWLKNLCSRSRMKVRRVVHGFRQRIKLNSSSIRCFHVCFRKRWHVEDLLSQPQGFR